MRNSKLKILLICSLTAFGAVSQEATGFRAGPNMAASEASLKDGFKLTDKAKEVIGVKIKNIGSKPYSIPSGALVHYGDKLGVYRVRDGWFKLVEVQSTNKENGTSTISSSELNEKDQIAIEGVALLRVSEMDIFGGEE
jgi:hypothetical protein